MPPSSRHMTVCCAFPSVNDGLVECWDKARNEGLNPGDPGYQPYLDNFTYYVRENPEDPQDPLPDGLDGSPINP